MDGHSSHPLYRESIFIIWDITLGVKFLLQKRKQIERIIK